MGKVLILDGAGRYVAAGDEAAGLVPPPGGTAVQVGDDIHDQLAAADAAAQRAGAPYELAWSGGKVVSRSRALTSDEQARALVVQAAQGAVGTAIGNLTAIQVRALLAVLLHKAGALDSAGVVQPLTNWAGR